MITLKSGDDKHVTIVSSNGLAEGSSPHTILPLGICLKCIKIPLHVCVGVWIAVRQVNSVFVVLELTLPCESIIVALILSLHTVLVVANVVSCSNPSSSVLLGLSI